MKNDARRRLEDLLDHEIDVARTLATTLDAERAALTGASPLAVEQQATEKMRLLAAIEKLEDERRAVSVAAEQGLPGARVARGTDIASTVAERWRTLMELMAGCRTANGLGMLVHQGAKAFEIWTGRNAPFGVMRQAVEQSIYGH